MLPAQALSLAASPQHRSRVSFSLINNKWYTKKSEFWQEAQFSPVFFQHPYESHFNPWVLFLKKIWWEKIDFMSLPLWLARPHPVGYRFQWQVASTFRGREKWGGADVLTFGSFTCFFSRYIFGRFQWCERQWCSKNEWFKVECIMKVFNGDVKRRNRLIGSCCRAFLQKPCTSKKILRSILPNWWNTPVSMGGHWY